MTHASDIRKNEEAVQAPPATDAGLTYIGRIHTPWQTRQECPRQGADDGPICELEIFEPWVAALDGIEELERIQVVYWLHEARRDLVRQSPGNTGITKGTFAIRSPVRPNPIGISVATLVARNGNRLQVRGLDCLDGTPLIDLKPERCPHKH